MIRLLLGDLRAKVTLKNPLPFAKNYFRNYFEI